MRTVVIGGKEYRIKASCARVEKLLTRKTTKRPFGFVIDATWTLLARKIIFKPFVCKWRMRDVMTIDESKKIDKILAEIFQGDRDKKNPTDTGD